MSFHSDSSSLRSFGVAATPQSIETTRLQYLGLSYEWSIPDILHSHVVQLWDKFTTDLRISSSGTDDQPASALELMSQFLLHIMQHELVATSVCFQSDRIVELLLYQIESDFLGDFSIQSIVSNLPGTALQKENIIQVYVAATQHVGHSNLRNAPRTAIFDADHSANQTKTYAIFGGQGNTTDYLKELRTLLETYTCVIEPILTTVDRTLHELLQRASPSRMKHFMHGLEISRWLRRPETAPPKDYLLSSPVSFPIIALLQFATYAVTCWSLKKTPGEVTQTFQAMTGHSQGIVVAAAISANATTWESLHDALIQALMVLFEIGVAAQEAVPQVYIPSTISTEVAKAGEGVPSPMLNVAGCDMRSLQTHIDEINRGIDENQQISIALINGRANFVVGGPTLSVCALARKLRKLKASPEDYQEKKPFSTRKPEFSLRFLPITAPFHTPQLRKAVPGVVAALQGVKLCTDSFQVPVYYTHTGHDPKRLDAENIVPHLVEMILCQVQDLPLSTEIEATHAVDFGPGGLSGVGSLLSRNKEGSGLRVILAGLFESPSPELGGIAELLSARPTFGVDWAKKYSPRLLQTKEGIQIQNKMTHLLGLPPFMVAGMTPTTTSWEFVGAIISAGYHAEVAAGGLHNVETFTNTMNSLAASIPSGRGICINIIYASPRQVKWQLPLIRKLRSEGLPIDGITFGAGVPSTEALREYLNIGLKYLSFKPGSASAISQVIAIARTNPDTPIILQWTSGRGGGHHSFEDFHDPMIKMYSKIRRCDNIVLLAGSGFGGADDTFPYLSGMWSSRFGLPQMPFDGILFGSRMMVAKEAKTSQAAKEAIVAAPGINEEASWEQSYKKPIGGVITIQSEMGEPIHMLATRGVLLWRELDETIFSISDRAQRLEKLLKMKPYIIKRLNDDSQKVWFGLDGHGNAVDIEDMTYAEVVRRLIQLCYVGKERRWIDQGYKELTADFMRRICIRLQRSVLQKVDMERPQQALQELLDFCKSAGRDLVTYSDVRYLLLLLKRQGQKPPPFVPVLDSDFETWYKKDSLWQSEDLASVVDEDAGRTCILQGPVAARFSVKINEPVADILGSISQQCMSRLLGEGYSDDETTIPTNGSAISTGLVSNRIELPECCLVVRHGSDTTISIDKTASKENLPSADSWIMALAGSKYTWLFSLLTSEDIVRDKIVYPNPIRRALAPLSGMRVELFDAFPSSIPSLIVYEKAASTQSALEIRKEGDIIFVTMSAPEPVGKVALSLSFRFMHRPDTPLHPIHEIGQDRNEKLRHFYDRLWFDSEPCQSGPDPVDVDLSRLVVACQPTRISPSSTRSFMDSIEQRGLLHTSKAGVPLDYSIVVAWEAMMKAAFAGAIGCDFLSLVHLSNKFTVLDESPLENVDLVTSTAGIRAIRNHPAGRTVEVVATIARHALPAVEVVSEFLFRGKYTDFSVCFEKRKPPRMVVPLDRMADIAVLRSKAWVSFDNDVDWKSLLGRRLVFDLQIIGHFASTTTYRSLQVSGMVFIEDPETRVLHAAGSVRYHSTEPTKSDPVMDYLNRVGSPLDTAKILPTPQSLGEKDSLSITTPLDNTEYARASGDFNPIHVSQTIARYADLPAPITHGMYTSAAVRQVVEKAAGCSEKVHMRSYKASFVNMVLPNSVLDVQVHHIAMRDGLRVLSFQALDSESGQVMLDGEAEVDQLLTAYVFTGQGSQQQDMGMDLYATSEVARQVWDEADKFYLETYGFLITNIVKQNPKQMTVFFGGRRGRKVRENYMKMMVESTDGRPERFFKSITPTTTRYTFQHNAGLLFSTEFAQPALTIMERAQFLHLESQGLVTSNALFAGHSLGEYTSLCTIGKIMSFQNLLSVVFYRGLTMKNAVERDSQGRSKFAMVAVNPSRAKTTPAMLLKLVASITSALPEELLEVVNYNVETQQYVAAGTLKALATLGDLMDYIAKNGALATTDMDMLVASTAAAINDEMPDLRRGLATIPLNGIDVPFHSGFLLPKMQAFRRVLQHYIEPGAIDSTRLVGKYISNVTGKPFDISYKGVVSLQELTGSIVLKQLMVEMEARQPGIGERLGECS